MENQNLIENEVLESNSIDELETLDTTEGVKKGILKKAGFAVLGCVTFLGGYLVRPLVDKNVEKFKSWREDRLKKKLEKEEEQKESSKKK